ncbi:MAG: bifunctional nuclease domain-containing protein [Myxococcales bacterium]
MSGPRSSFVALVLIACSAGAVCKLLQRPAHDGAIALEYAEIVHVRGGQVLVLKEASGPRRLPVPISRAEAALIERALKGPRGLAPATIEALGGRVLGASIDSFGQRTFRGHLSLGAGSREVRIESTAGEALALALQAGAPIVADPAVLDEAAISPEDLHGKNASNRRSDATPAPVLHI